MLILNKSVILEKNFKETKAETSFYRIQEE